MINCLNGGTDPKMFLTSNTVMNVDFLENMQSAQNDLLIDAVCAEILEDTSDVRKYLRALEISEYYWTRSNEI